METAPQADSETRAALREAAPPERDALKRTISETRATFKETISEQRDDVNEIVSERVFFWGGLEPDDLHTKQRQI